MIRGWLLPLALRHSCSVPRSERCVKSGVGIIRMAIYSSASSSQTWSVFTGLMPSLPTASFNHQCVIGQWSNWTIVFAPVLVLRLAIALLLKSCPSFSPLGHLWTTCDITDHNTGQLGQSSSPRWPTPVRQARIHAGSRCVVNFAFTQARVLSSPRHIIAIDTGQWGPQQWCELLPKL